VFPLSISKSIPAGPGFSRADTQAIDDPDLRLLPCTAGYAFHLFDLPTHHTDLFDRQIIRRALCEDIPIGPCDEKFSLCRDLEVVW
jgi:PIN domain nuclease of toxin-antitoxin system